MLMQYRHAACVVEVLSPEDLWDPEVVELMIIRKQKDEQTEPELIAKSELSFLSGEKLPVCWNDAHYSVIQWSPFDFGILSRATDHKSQIKNS